MKGQIRDVHPSLWNFQSLPITFKLKVYCPYQVFPTSTMWSSLSLQSRVIVLALFPLLHFCSVAQSCPTLCNPMDCSTPGFPVLHHLAEFAQAHVHFVNDVIQLSYPLSPLLLLPSIFPSIRMFSNELALRIRWPKDLLHYCSLNKPSFCWPQDLCTCCFPQLVSHS